MKVSVVVTDEQGNVFGGEATLEPVAREKKARLFNPRTTPAGELSTADRSFDVVKVAERISDLDEYDQMEAQVLSKRKPLLRLMLCLYAVRKDPSPYLSTTDMERLTNQLNVRVFANNMGRIIKDNLKYFTADAIRAGRGTRPRYKLNRQGISVFERLLKGEAL